ncbi:MAG TPA: cytidine deaminase [Actinobacteria bacterium]|nr:cytidine deaminase [Actinomycetota bacterium]
MTDRERLERAREAATGAYAPYSAFAVGALVVGGSGREYLGTNVENAAFPASICAEANAISTAVAAGERRIEAVYVVCLRRRRCMPCGNCRQIMREFGVDRVVVEGPDGPETIPFAELLPRSFGPEDLSDP